MKYESNEEGYKLFASDTKGYSNDDGVRGDPDFQEVGIDRVRMEDSSTVRVIVSVLLNTLFHFNTYHKLYD